MWTDVFTPLRLLIRGFLLIVIGVVSTVSDIFACQSSWRGDTLPWPQPGRGLSERVASHDVLAFRSEHQS